MTGFSLLSADKADKFLVLTEHSGVAILAGRIERRGDRWAIIHVSDAVWGMTMDPLGDLLRFVEQIKAEIPPGIGVDHGT